LEAVGLEDARLQRLEGGGGFGFGGVVLGDGDVDNGAGGDCWREEDGGEFDLEEEEIEVLVFVIERVYLDA